MDGEPNSNSKETSKQRLEREKRRAGDEGIEPPPAVLETAVLPLN